MKKRITIHFIFFYILVFSCQDIFSADQYQKIEELKKKLIESRDKKCKPVNIDEVLKIFPQRQMASKSEYNPSQSLYLNGFIDPFFTNPAEKTLTNEYWKTIEPIYNNLQHLLAEPTDQAFVNNYENLQKIIFISWDSYCLFTNEVNLKAMLCLADDKPKEAVDYLDFVLRLNSNLEKYGIIIDNWDSPLSYLVFSDSSVIHKYLYLVTTKQKAEIYQYALEKLKNNDIFKITDNLMINSLLQTLNKYKSYNLSSELDIWDDINFKYNLLTKSEQDVPFSVPVISELMNFYQAYPNQFTVMEIKESLDRICSRQVMKGSIIDKRSFIKSSKKIIHDILQKEPAFKQNLGCLKHSDMNGLSDELKMCLYMRGLPINENYADAIRQKHLALTKAAYAARIFKCSRNQYPMSSDDLISAGIINASDINNKKIRIINIYDQITSETKRLEELYVRQIINRISTEKPPFSMDRLHYKMLSSEKNETKYEITLEGISETFDKIKGPVYHQSKIDEAKTKISTIKQMLNSYSPMITVIDEEESSPVKEIERTSSKLHVSDSKRIVTELLNFQITFHRPRKLWVAYSDFNINEITKSTQIELIKWSYIDNILHCTNPMPPIPDIDPTDYVFIEAENANQKNGNFTSKK